MSDDRFRIRYDESSSIAYYQMDLLRNRNDGRFAGIIAGTDPQGIRLSFITEDLISIGKYYASAELTRKDAICILDKMIDNARWCISNLLDPACLLTESEHIYYKDKKHDDDADRTFIMTYLPVRDPSCVNRPAKLSDEFMDFLEYASPAAAFDREEMIRLRNMDLFCPDECKALSDSLKVPKEIEKSTSKTSKISFDKLNLAAFIVFAFSQILLLYAGYHILMHIDRFSSPLPVITVLSLILIMIAATDLYVFFNRKSPLKRYVKEIFSISKSLPASSVSGQFEDRTVLINSPACSSRTAMLCAGIPGTSEEAKNHKGFILSDDFLIGRDPSKVDFRIDNSSVGRIHARITRRQNSFYIEDLGSHNGTYIDGKRIRKGTDNLLPDKCRICFADKEYYFLSS